MKKIKREKANKSKNKDIFAIIKKEKLNVA